MASGEAGENDVILDHAMAGEGSVVGKDDVVPEDTVVSHVGVGEKEVIVSDGGRSGFLGAPVDGDVFPENISITHDETGWFTGIFQILGFNPDGGERKKFVFCANCRMSVDHHVRVQLATCAESNICFDDTERTDFDVFPDGGFWRNDS